jgi:hypothetical protein
VVLVGKPEGRRPLGRPRRKWEYDIEIELEETVCKDVDWVHWRVHMNTEMNFGCRIFFEKLIVTQLVKQYPAFFMKSEGSLP